MLFFRVINKKDVNISDTLESDLLNEYPHFALMPVPLAPERKSIFTLDVSGLDVFPFSKGVPSSSDMFQHSDNLLIHLN